LHLELSVFERYFKGKRRSHFYCTRSFERSLNAEVHLVGKSIEGTDRTINVHNSRRKQEAKLITGIVLLVGSAVDSKKGLAILLKPHYREQQPFCNCLLDNKNKTYFKKSSCCNRREVRKNFVELIPDNQINIDSKKS
jgi:cobalt-zinc-cadmium efflux system membrane fusion protein